jgi:uncharacterized membrane protein HdeD (DUF308 family)
MLVLSGIVSIAFGLLVFFFPAQRVALVWLISLYASSTGVLLLAVGRRARRDAHALLEPMNVPTDRSPS